MHGTSRRRGKQSEYSLQLMEMQKAKYTYGLLERQFARLFNKASRKDGVTGELLSKYLEARLDNTVYRLGIAPTRAAARQLVRSSVARRVGHASVSPCRSRWSPIRTQKTTNMHP